MKNLYEGTISCKAILEAQKRKCHTLYVDSKKRTKDFAYIIRLAKKQNVKVKICSRKEMDELSGSSKHGGMLLQAEDGIKQRLNEKKDGLIVYVDGIEDPYNLGSIARTLYASGAQALILPDRDWSYSQQIILKASAGAFEKLSIYWIDKEQDLIDYLHKYNIPLLCAHRKDAISLYDYHFEVNCCIALGGSFRGLSSLIVKNSKQNIVIPYGNDFRNALDAPSAISILAFEYLRQRR
ncbi:TrmH family RNA methyltransferase [Floccifex sp.]|uniref:TrmH family RNA methyltransferase n=1 Tax=Floccifex sp. TaxID=2815810 RepID=UPI003F0CBC88